MPAQPFLRILANERRLRGDCAAFYYWYSFATLVYEVRTAIGSVLFRFRLQYQTLPRFLARGFMASSDAVASIPQFCKVDSKVLTMDHHPRFCKEAISAMCLLASTGPEATPAAEVLEGYSGKNLAFDNFLVALVITCYVPKSTAFKLATDIIRLLETHGLNVSQFGGKPCKTDAPCPLLQISSAASSISSSTVACSPDIRTSRECPCLTT